MSTHENKSVFEEVNPFPEKVSVSSSIDGGSPDFIEEDSGSILGELEEIALGETFGGTSISIDDDSLPEESSYAGSKSLKKDNPRPFDVESLAREIDSMNTKASPAQSGSGDDSEFLTVLDDEDRRLIDEVTSKTDEIELEMFEPVGSLEEEDDRAQLVVAANIKYKPVSLWKEDSDFKVIEVEGYQGIDSDDFLSYLRTKDRSSDADAAVPSGLTVIGKSVRDNDIGIQSPPDEDSVLEHAFEDQPFEISDNDLHDSSILEDLVFSPSELNDGSTDDADDEIISLPEDALLSLSEEAEEDSSDNDIFPVNMSDIVEDAEPENVPEDFILTPIDLSEAEKIAREDILVLNEDDLIEELDSSESSYNKYKKESNGKAVTTERKIQYVHPPVSTMDNHHRASIEENILAPESLVIEEDSSEIERRYGKNTLKGESESLLDITDEVVILEDESDVDRLSMSIPEEKREDMKKLLHYLDGLFEKLPDDVVKNFANSEYFDLYVKIMNDLGDK